MIMRCNKTEEIKKDLNGQGNNRRFVKTAV